MNDEGASDSRIYELAKIVNRDNLELGENSQIDDFVFLNAGEFTQVGNNSCIHAGSRVIGGGELEVGDNVAITYNCVLVTGYPQPSSHMSTCVPKRRKDTITGKISIGDEAFVGSCSVIMPNTVIGKGSVVCALSYVDEDIPPWTVQYPDGTRRDREPFPVYESK